MKTISAFTHFAEIRKSEMGITRILPNVELILGKYSFTHGNILFVVSIDLGFVLWGVVGPIWVN